MAARIQVDGKDTMYILNADGSVTCEKTVSPQCEYCVGKCWVEPRPEVQQ